MKNTVEDGMEDGTKDRVGEVSMEDKKHGGGWYEGKSAGWRG